MSTIPPTPGSSANSLTATSCQYRLVRISYPTSSPHRPFSQQTVAHSPLLQRQVHRATEILIWLHSVVKEEEVMTLAGSIRIWIRNWQW